jgi:NhaP-type Na+/H+ or K+/H+ antiporter
MMRWVAPLATVVAVLAAGLWFWWPPGENHNRYSDLGTTLIGGAIVGVAVLYVERRLTRGVERRDLQLQLGLTDAIPGID